MPDRGGRDASGIIAAAALRNFGYGLISVEIALYWRAHGVPALMIGLLFTLALLASGALSAVAGRLSATSAGGGAYSCYPWPSSLAGW